MKILYTSTFIEDLRCQIEFFRKEDEYHGTNLCSQLKQAIEDVEDYVVTFPKGFQGIDNIRQVILPKFKHHYITYRIGDKRIEFLKLRSFWQKS